MKLKLMRGRDGRSDGDVFEVLSALESLAERRRAATTEICDRPAPPPADGSPRHSGRLLGSLLVVRGYLVADELQSILAYQSTSGKRLGEILVESGWISDRVLAELLAEQFRLPVVDLAQTKIDPVVARAIPESEEREMVAIPIRRNGDLVKVAIADPTNQEALERLKQTLGSSLRLVVAPASTIAAALDDVWRARHQELSGTGVGLMH